MSVTDPPPGCCWCSTCEDERLSTPINRVLHRRFIVCPDCGNKRCPKATHHDQDCTNSNAPGQPGSRYQ